MALIRPLRDGEHDDTRLQEAGVLFDSAMALFTGFVKRAGEGDTPSTSEMKQAAGDLLRSAQSLSDARKKLDEERRRQAGIVHDYAVDFDAARSEVRGLLDRLRAARASGELPE